MTEEQQLRLRKAELETRLGELEREVSSVKTTLVEVNQSLNRLSGGNKRALLVGINYTNTPNQLEGCITDVLNIKRFLMEKCGWLEESIELLTDETVLKPSRVNIESKLQALVHNAQAGDTVLFHYSGHGSRVRDRSGDESDGVDEVLVPVDYSTAGMIPDDWLREHVCAKVPAQVTLWAFMDCCHSGTAMDLRHNYRSACRLKKGRLTRGAPYVPGDWTDQFVFAVERSRELPVGTGSVYAFSGALDREYAADALIEAKRQGAFTFALLKTLESNLDSNTGKWVANRLRIRNALKEINCRLDLSGYLRQQCQLSLSKADLFETFLNL